MFINSNYFGYNIDNPLSIQSIPQSIKDMYYLNLIEEIQTENIVTENIEWKLINLSNTKNIEEAMLYYPKLMSEIISVYDKKELEDNKEDNKDMDSFSILSGLEYSLWIYPLSAVLRIKKEREAIKKYYELRMYYIIEQACAITIPVGEEHQSEKINNRKEFIQEMFGADEKIEGNNKLPENVKRFPDKLPSFGSMIRHNVVSEH